MPHKMDILKFLGIAIIVATMFIFPYSKHNRTSNPNNDRNFYINVMVISLVIGAYKLYDRYGS
ncbi:hypothetical protein J6A64_01805 [bacterium]|nr:hypothetical protein [bacterium]